MAAGSLWLTWNACAPDPGAAHDAVFGCADNTSSYALHAAFTLAAPVDSVLGAELVLDVQSAEPTLPNWWQVGTGGCRAGALTGSLAFGTSGCADPWAGQATVGFPSYTPGMPRGGPSQARIRIGVGVAPNAPRALAAGTLYQAVRLVMATTRTDSCSGCAGQTCIVLNSILLRRTPTAAGGDVFVSTPAPADANWATWQGTGANCTAVPVRRNVTWGALKSLYR
jgi:hypothetical protein